MSPYSLPKGLIPVMIMPFSEDDQIDYDTLSELTELFLNAGVAGLFANCLSTEMYHLSDEERLGHTRHVIRQVKGRVPVVASGTFGGPLKKQADVIRKVYDTGVDAVVLITSQLVLQHEPDSIFWDRLERLLDLTRDVPLGLYECPVPYKRLVTAEMLGRLAATGRVIYHKDTSCSVTDVAAKLKAIEGYSFGLYDAHLPNAVTSLRAGAQGLSAIAANYFPEILVWLCNNVDQPDQSEKVNWLEATLTRTNELIHTAYPVSAKYFLQNRGLPITLHSRTLPQLLDETQRRAIGKLAETFHEWCHILDIEPVTV